MCLAVPMKLVQISDSNAFAEIGGVQRQISLMLLPDAQIGDYVIVHAGFAIQKLNEAEAQKTLELLEQIAALDDSTDR
jgi:hydrogenase expression/formation protein HypC